MPQLHEQLDGREQSLPISPAEITMDILQELDVHPLRARDLLRLDTPLDQGEYSYLLTLRSAQGQQPRIFLTLMPVRLEDLFEDQSILVEKRRRLVNDMWGQDTHLLRFGELSVTDQALRERHPVEVAMWSDLAMHTLLFRNDARQDNLGFHEI